MRTLRLGRSLRLLRIQFSWRLRGWHRPGRSPISFSQVQEDLAVEALIGTVRAFVDVGANDGVTYSNTVRFALQGARGLAFEPVPGTYAELAAFYRFNPRVHCINEAASDHDAMVPMCDTGLFSSIEQGARSNRAIDVRCRPLRAWLERYPSFFSADLLNVDVEGHEFMVLLGAGFPRFRPRCIVLETHGGRHARQNEIDALLHANDYVEVLRSPLNSFYVGRAIPLLEAPESVAARLRSYCVPAGPMRC